MRFICCFIGFALKYVTAINCNKTVITVIKSVSSVSWCVLEYQSFVFNCNVVGGPLTHQVQEIRKICLKN